MNTALFSFQPSRHFRKTTQRLIGFFIMAWMFMNSISIVQAAPPAPAVVTATGISTTQIQVSWTDSLTNETRFDIQAYNGSSWSSVGSKQGDTTTGLETFTHTLSFTALPNRYRTYQVRAVDASGTGPWSTSSNIAYTWVNTPNAPLVSNITSTTADVRLSLPDGNPQAGSVGVGDTEYAIKEKDTGQIFVDFTSFWDGSFTIKRVTNLQPGTAYNFVAVARNGERVESVSAPTTFTTVGTAPPLGFTVLGTTSNTISVRWGPGGGDEINYEVYIRKIDGSGYDLDGIVADDGRLSEYQYTYTNADQTGPTVTPNVDYNVYVTAVGTTRQSSGIQQAITPPKPISLSSSNLTSTSVDLSINTNGNSELTLYEIYQESSLSGIRYLGSGTSLPLWQTAAQWPNPHRVGLQGGLDYTFTPYLKSVTGQIIAGTPLNLQAPPTNPTPPTGSIVINLGNPNYTTTANVILYLNYNDDIGVQDVHYSNDGVFDTESWETPAAAKAWTVSVGDGLKTVYYQIRDTNGALSLIYSDTITLDSTPPVITVVGSNPVTVIQGDPYTDAGATASDNLDGNITSDIVTNNPVDTATAGSYTVTYNVSDTAGNPAPRMTRTVNVVTEITYEDGSDGNTNPWFINPTGAAGTIQNIVDGDPAHDRVIELAGATAITRMVFYALTSNPWAAPGKLPIMQWDMKYSGKANALIMLKTNNTALNNGYQYLSYGTDNTPGLKNHIVYYRLDSAIADGNWHTLTRNLQKDLAAYLPGTVIEKIQYFSIYGTGRLDNLKMMKPLPLATVSGTVRDHQNNPLSGVMVSAPLPAGIGVLTDASGSYILPGLAPGNYTLIFQRSGYIFFDVFITVDAAGTDLVVDTAASGVLNSITYENGSDGDTAPWFINPTGASGTIQNATDADTEHGQVIELTGTTTNSTRMVFYAPLNNPWVSITEYPFMQWDMKYSNQANILIMLKTNNTSLNNGYQYLSYATNNTPGLRNHVVYYQLDSGLADGNWHAISRNLQQDLEAYLPGTVIEKIQYFSIYGNGRVDNLMMSK